MARIQPSFLKFYLSRTRQRNTSFLLTSKDELKYPSFFFLNNPNFYPFRQKNVPLKNNSKLSPQVIRYIQRARQDFAHIHPTSPNPFKKITFSKTKVKPHSRGTIHNPAWPQTSQYFNTTRFFSIPLWGRSSENLVCLYQYPKYRSHSREISQNTSEFHNFSKLTPSHSLNYGYEHFP